MKFSILYILFCLVLISGVQAQVSEHFPDGKKELVWYGDTAFWVSDKGMLHSLGPAVSGSEIALYTQGVTGPETEWEIFVNLKLSTSSNNYLDWILCSDSIPGATGYRGYFIRLGSQSDDICLYRKDGTTQVKIFDGPDGMINGTSNNPFRLKIVRDLSGLFGIWYQQDTNKVVFDSLGSCTDGTFPAFTWTGMRAVYSSANYNKFYLDNIYAGPVRKDTLAPEAERVKVRDAHTLLLLFNEPVDTSLLIIRIKDQDGNEAGNTEMSRDTDDYSNIWIKFTSGTLSSGSSYYLVLLSYDDIHGNAGQPDSLLFTFYIPEAGDVIFSEIMPDPSPAKGLPESEYIELYNTSVFTLSLENWLIKDHSSQVRLPDVDIKPGAYLVLYPATSVPPNDSFSVPVALSATFLNNAGDELFLEDDKGKQVDMLAYNDHWHGTSIPAGGISLERRYPGAFCHPQKTNWSSSISPSGGTPGYRNSVFLAVTDTSVPELKQLTCLNDHSLLLVFERFPGWQMQQLSRYSAEGNRPAEVIISSDSILLRFTTAFIPDPFYWKVLTVDTFFDCSGHWYTSLSDSFRFADAETPTYKAVLFSELMIRPSPSRRLPVVQYIELQNRAPVAVSMTGSRLQCKGVNYMLPSTVLYPSEVLLLVPEGYADSFPGCRAVAMEKFPSLPVNEGELFLINETGDMVDAVGYHSSWYGNELKAQGGWSLERGDTLLGCQDKNFWKASGDPAGGSPGRVNGFVPRASGMPAPLVVRSYPLSREKVKVFFSEGMVLEMQNTENWMWNGKQDILSAFPSDAYFREWEIELAGSMVEGAIYQLEVNGKDCYGNVSTTMVKAGLPVPDSSWVLNEILFDPYTGGNDFVEIIHFGSGIVDLKNCRLASEKDGALKDPVNIAPEGFLLFPGEMLVLTTGSGSLETFYNVPVPGNVLVLPSFPSFPDNEGVVILLDSSGALRDRFAYTEEMHMAVLSSKNGVSLERIDPRLATQDNNNWASAASVKGFATPTGTNSHYLSAGGRSDVWLSSVTFSPDGDGNEDLAVLCYRFHEPGWLARVRIYTADGVLVQDLSNVSYLEKEGIFTWDGTNMQGQPSGIGVYLIWMEVFRDNAPGKSYKLPLVLARHL